MTGVHIRDLSPAQRSALLEVLRSRVATGTLSLGQVLWLLRVAHLGITRAQYASATGVSERELAKLEADAGNPTLRTLERVFAPFGLRVGLVRSAQPGVEAIAYQLPDRSEQRALEAALDDAVQPRLRKLARRGRQTSR